MRLHDHTRCQLIKDNQFMNVHVNELTDIKITLYF